MADMKRRSALRLLGTAPLGVGFGIGIAEALAARESVAAALRAAEDTGGYAPRFFSEHEWRTVRVLVDWILPADERSGSATDAAVPEFMDFLMADPEMDDRSLEHRQVAMRGGLAGSTPSAATASAMTSSGAARTTSAPCSTTSPTGPRTRTRGPRTARSGTCRCA